jgi:hypothetical protein
MVQFDQQTVLSVLLILVSSFRGHQQAIGKLPLATNKHQSQVVFMLNHPQGTLTEGEGTVPLTSQLSYHVL